MCKFIVPAEDSHKNTIELKAIAYRYFGSELNTDIKRWYPVDLDKFLALCLSLKYYDYACVACLVYYHDITIEECFGITVKQAVKTMKSNYLEVKKSKFRSKRYMYIKEIVVKISFMKILEKPSKMGFIKLLERQTKEDKLFVGADSEILSAIEKFESFVKSHSPGRRINVW